MQTTLETTLPRSTPEAQGISSTAISNFLNAVKEQGLELHSLMLVRHGQVVAEGWWQPYSSDKVHLLYSVSKSFTATAIGFAIDEGLLSADDLVTSLFPNDLPEKMSEPLAAMRVRHLLSMATGHVEDTLERTAKSDNWVKGFLSLPPEQAPGSVFCYNNGATFMLSAIIQKLTGMKLLEYLRPRLFEPLGITKMRWDENPRGLNLGFSGFHTTTEAVAKFGQLYLQNGMWQGKQLLSEQWVKTATREHIPCASPSGEDVPDWQQGYGYQFWMCQHGCYRADGAFGQYCVVMPKQDAVLAITSAVQTMQDVLDLTWEHLLPAMTDTPLADNATNQRSLSNQLANLTISPVKGENASPILEAVSEQTYQLESTTEENLHTITLHFREQDCLLKFTDHKQEHQIICAYNQWLSGTTTFYTPVNNFHTRPAKIEASGAWTDPNTFTVEIIYSESPHCLTVSCHFDGNNLTLKRHWNVSFGPLELPVLTGNK
jgi:CubicO group peptidase (beta-lactamase class C family)